MITTGIAFKINARLSQDGLSLGSKMRHGISAYLGVGMVGGQILYLVKRAADNIALGIVAQQVEGAGEIIERTLPRGGKSHMLSRLGKGNACRKSTKAATYYYRIERHFFV